MLSAMTERDAAIEAAEVVVSAEPLDATVAFFVDRLGFRVEAIIPADAPAVAVVVGHGVRLRLARGVDTGPGMLRLRCREPRDVAGGETELIAPNGTRVELVPAEPPLVLPALAPAFCLSRATDAAWHPGRAGMAYRDLVPDRQGGRFIASHIRIPDAGPVPDYAHYHAVRFQMIFCYRGWVRVVYEDQGPPFVLRAGDCVLQPPRIRHRVLESGDGLEVVELGCPAVHETWADLDMSLPTTAVRPDRDFGGQRFVRHEAASATWRPWRVDGFESRDIGIGAATDGLAGARVARPVGPVDAALRAHDAELVFGFVLAGTASLVRDGCAPAPLGAADSFVVPAGMAYALADCSGDFELLDVTLPAVV